jgi:phosphoribosyl 1,2-cyclic phosphodiesterase
METTGDSIIFLGTGGARYMVSKQLLATGGAWLFLAGRQILFDPGPGALVHAIRRKLDPGKLDAVILSHKHLDHSSDINVIIEAMTNGRHEKRGVVFAPADALEEKSEPVILRYLLSNPEKVVTLKAGGAYQLGDLSFTTPVRHVHGVETYGFVFNTPESNFSWITDTQYFPALAKHYRAPLVILNILRQHAGPPLDHLSADEATVLLNEMQPRRAVLTHFGMNMWKGHPWEIAAQMSADTGVEVTAARDGQTILLDGREAGQGSLL